MVQDLVVGHTQNDEASRHQPGVAAPVSQRLGIPSWSCRRRRSAKRSSRTRGMAAALARHAGRADLDGDSQEAYREAEEQIRYYAPARYLCGLTETDWTPDLGTIADFAQLLGEDGCRLLNEAVVKRAVELGLADPCLAVADMTAQEAAIPHPYEVGLLGGFVRSIADAAKRAGRHVPGSQGACAEGPAFRQEQEQGGQGPNGWADGEYRRGNQPGAGQGGRGRCLSGTQVRAFFILTPRTPGL